MAERWHQETSNFHPPVGDIPIAGRLIEEDDLNHDNGVKLMVNHLLFPVEEAVEQVSNNFGALVMGHNGTCLSCMSNFLLPPAHMLAPLEVT